jgi:GNAT superfamily N-acetyltransferase
VVLSPLIIREGSCVTPRVASWMTTRSPNDRAGPAWPFVIERLARAATDTDIRQLAQLLVDTVESGAAVSFLAPLSLERAEAWWRHTLSSSSARAIFLVARDENGIAGSVQMQPAWAPNQPHRADIVKLLVHRHRRRMGMGAQLMQAIENAARQSGITLLTLDAKRGEAAEHLYRRSGWIEVGTIPEYALDSDGTPHDAVIFYKRLV